MIKNPIIKKMNKAMNESLEANTMAILDSTGLRDSRDVYDDKFSFLEAVRNASLISDSPIVPSWKIFNAVFEILKGSNSLELAMTSYQLLTDLDKHYPRIYLKRSDDEECGLPTEVVVVKEAWSPYSTNPETSQREERRSRNPFHADSLATSICTLIEEVGQYIDIRDSQLQIKPAVSVILFQYLISVIENDFSPRHTLYKETLDWSLLRESLLSMLLGSRKLNFKRFVRDCLSIMYKRCNQHNGIKLRDLKCTSSMSGSAKAAQDCSIALAYVVNRLKRQCYIAMEKLFTLIMELDVMKNEADSKGITSRADGLRSPIMDVILDDLTYVKDYLSPFLEVFSEPKWKLEIILGYFSKYWPKTSVRTRRNELPKDVTFEDMLNYFLLAANLNFFAKTVTLEDTLLLLAHGFQAYLSLLNTKQTMDDAEKAGSKSLICGGLLSAFQNIRKVDNTLEVTAFEKEALFTAATILSQKS